MAEKLDFFFQVFQTTFHVIYDDITHLDADIIVSTDDTFFSGSSGISKKIQQIVGKSTLQKEVRKQRPPVPIGTVMITSSGSLQAKYIAHVAVLDFARHLNPLDIIPKITGRIIDFGDAIQVQSIITPILIEKSTDASGGYCAALSQLTGQPITNVLGIVLKSMAHHIVNKNNAISLRSLTIAMYQDEADDHAITEQELLAELTPIHQEIIDWTTTLDSVNDWMVHIQPLLAHLDDGDKELRDLLIARFNGGRDVLNTIFSLSGPDQSSDAPPLDSGEDQTILLDQEEFKHRQQRLSSILSDLQEETASIRKQIKETRRRLYTLQENLAEFGELEAPAHLKLEIEDTQQEIERLDQQREERERQQTELHQRLAILECRWNTQQQATVTTS